MIQGKRYTLLAWCEALIVAVWGCSTSDSGLHGDAGEAAANTGGTSAAGGDAATGGQVGSGGSNASTGDIGTGGTQGPRGLGGVSGTVTPSTGGVRGPGGGPGTGGRENVGGRTGTGGSQAPGGTSGSGGVQSTGGVAGTSGSCSATAPVGLETGMLIPEVQLQHCDGSPVGIHDLVCGKPLTQVYSYAAWCPGCRGFSGLEEGGSFMTGNSLYDKYHDKGYEQVIILSATAKYGQAPTAADCAELQTLHEGLVVFDASGKKTQQDLGLRVNGGTGLVDSQGVWVVPPPVDDPQDGGLVAVFTELTSRFGFR